ncbi:MAG: hypothetical protein GX900_06170 [Clostridiaceae bacterium]|jgi:hypothetical protein|nr:hypothetical protein [Clostridiaceae bacterium]
MQLERTRGQVIYALYNTSRGYLIRPNGTVPLTMPDGTATYRVSILSDEFPDPGEITIDMIKDYANARMLYASFNGDIRVSLKQVMQDIYKDAISARCELDRWRDDGGLARLEMRLKKEAQANVAVV